MLFDRRGDRLSPVFVGDVIVGISFRGRMLPMLAAAVLATALALPAPASAFSCSQKGDFAASAQYGQEQPVGFALSCVPGLSCQTPGGCRFTVRASIDGIGVVGATIQGPFGVVSCGPAALTCSIATPDFDVPFGGAAVRCWSGTTAAAHVELVCLPSQIR